MILTSRTAAGSLNDGVGTGLCIVVFDTEEHAKAAVTLLTPPDGPTVITDGIYEVEVEAWDDSISAKRATRSQDRR